MGPKGLPQACNLAPGLRAGRGRPGPARCVKGTGIHMRCILGAGPEAGTQPSPDCIEVQRRLLAYRYDPAAG